MSGAASFWPGFLGIVVLVAGIPVYRRKMDACAAVHRIFRRRAETIAMIARFWTAFVLVFYGIENILFPQFSPGVPDAVPTPAWVPMHAVVAYVTGVLLVACGAAMFSKPRAAAAAAGGGLVMMLLTAGLYIPQWIMASTVGEQVNALNFVFDTLLFAGTVLTIGGAISKTGRPKT